MIKRYFPPVRETVLLVVITLAFLLLTATCIGLRTEHFLMTGLFLVRGVLSLLGACAYSFRFVALSEGRSPDVSPFCYGLPVG